MKNAIGFQTSTQLIQQARQDAGAVIGRHRTAPQVVVHHQAASLLVHFTQHLGDKVGTLGGEHRPEAENKMPLTGIAYQLLSA